MDRPFTGQEDIFVGGVSGLSVRRGAKGASWVLRGRIKGATTVRTWTLAGYDDLNLREARERAAAALQMARDGTDPAPWLSGLSGANSRKPKAPPVEVRKPVPYREALESFLKEKAQTTVEATVRSYKSDLMHSDVVSAFQTMDDITVDGLQGVVDSLTKRGKRTQAINVRRNLLTLLRWAATVPSIRFSRDRIATLEEETAVGQVSKKMARNQKAERLPSLEAMSEFLWKLDAASAPVHMKLGLVMLALTGQRIKTLREAEAGWFKDGHWEIPGRAMKSGRDHAIPLGPFGLAVSEALVKSAPTDPSGKGLLFPGRHIETQDDDEEPTAKAMTYRPFNELCHEALGDSLHPLRHAFATYGEARLGLERLTLQALMDHSERSVFERAYAHGKRTELMRSALVSWEIWFLNISRREEHLPRFLPDLPVPRL
ncbi:tyrosine-type recombinase/integrase [Roseococcus sp. SDR]|uniref:tyrosine-type recombinase/integrase n=1 Tax=Roseococcus sp. SDR TaxID=2835532 RepID=UPI001BCFBBF4|nr:tyrosine-type recombinase/integrase [Roseococcus sp. SDR]MBS7792450.1 tyrosine-type recombinase/integrase [Roseococcus sp. SDR]MBV1847764.1 tyrosine-type recombinase/integrase [Roseococcus sp. SDR]